MRTFEIHAIMQSHKEGDPPCLIKYEGSCHGHDMSEEKARKMFEKIVKVFKSKG